MALSLPSIFAFMRYLRHLVATRRRAPKDDLISALIAVEEGGERLSENELIAMLVLLIIAGHETTVNLIGSGTLALMEIGARRASPWRFFAPWVCGRGVVTLHGAR